MGVFGGTVGDVVGARVALGCTVAVSVAPVGAMGNGVCVAGAIEGKGVNVSNVLPAGIEVASIGVMLGVAKAMLTVSPQPVEKKLKPIREPITAENILGRIVISWICAR